MGRPPILRVQGQLRSLETTVTSAEIADSFFNSIANEQSKILLGSEGQVDFAFTLDAESGESRSFRVNAVKSLRGVAITMRLISNKIPSPESIGITKKVLNTIEDGTGLFLVTGATGSGKSTTLASVLQWLANTSDRKIVTVEQPIEYRFDHGQSVIVQREVPNHARSFSDTLRSMLRQDPDIIMVGELRDLEEIRVALQAVESGHLVLSTVHTNSAAESINRLVDVFPGEEQELIKVMLSQCLLGVISQDLIPKPNNEGRTLAYEVLLNNPAIGNLIRRGQTERIDSTIQTSAREGMFTFDSNLLALLERGTIDLESAIRHARKKDDVAKTIAQMRKSGRLKEYPLEGSE